MTTPKPPATPKAISPRQHEWQAVLGLIEDALTQAILGNPVDLEAVAKAITKGTYRQLTLRDSVILQILDEEDRNIGVYGPWSSEVELRKFVETKLSLPEGWRPNGVHLKSPVNFDDKFIGGSPSHCGTCGHRLTLHLRDGAAYSKCGISDCACARAKK